MNLVTEFYWDRFVAYVDDSDLSSKFADWEGNARHNAFIMGFLAFCDFYNNLRWNEKQAEEDEGWYMFIKLPILNVSVPATARIVSHYLDNYDF